MQLIHKLGTRTISKETDDETHFLLTNKKLGYAYFPNRRSPGRESRYMGVFFPYNNSLYRVVSGLGLKKGFRVRKVVNRFYNLERHVTGNKEIYSMPYNQSSIAYRLKKRDWVNISLDIRPSYEPFALGRFYRLSLEGDKLLVEYTKKDIDTGGIEYRLYVAIKPEDLDYDEVLNWRPVYYALDFERGSPPAEMSVYDLVDINSRRLVISFSDNKKKALAEADYVFDNLRDLERRQGRYIKDTIRDADLEKKLIGRGLKRKEIYFAYNACKLSLDQLSTGEGIYAGLPWFFQVWSRDELISLKNLSFKERKGILFRDLENIQEDGRVPSILPGFSATNADSVGWLFKRLDESLNLFRLRERKFIRDRVIKSLCRMNENYLRDGFISNRSRETWMDSVFGDDGRLGMRIEVQAMLLNAYRLGHRLTRHERAHREFLFLEESLREEVRRGFWDGEVLADGLGDRTIRPNIFLAAYIYPGILSREEWTTCFLNSLPRLWLSWGGVSTIDKESGLFTGKHTGERVQSYHRGDSWYFLNNLAALILYRTDRKGFQRYIKKILSASTGEILWSGMIGHHSELSSAGRRESCGCGAQAWSNAMYMELIDEIYKT